MKIFKFNSQSGITFVEMLVYIGIFTIVLGILVSAMIWVYKANIRSQTMRQVIDSANQAMERMAYEIREAEAVYTPTTNQNQLSLQGRHYLPAGESTSFVDIFLCGQRLCLKKEATEPIALTPIEVRINSLDFSLIPTSSDPMAVGISLQIENNDVEISVSSTVSIRNY